MNIISISMDFGWTKYKQFANDLVLYEIDDTVVINVYTDTLRLASRIKNLVFRKFELDEQIINMLIDTLLYVKLGEERMVNIKTYPTDAKIANPTVSHEIFKCITEAKLFELQLILKSNQNQIFEFNGQTIWHRLAIASATYTLDAIIQLTTMLKTYCSQLNINKIASTNDTIGFVTSLQEKNLKITHIPSIDTNKYFNLETKVYHTYYNATSTHQINKLRPVTIAFYLRNKMTGKMMSGETISSSAFDHVIDLFTEINQNLISVEVKNIDSNKNRAC